MKTFETYGFAALDINAVRAAIESALGIAFQQRENSYGIYYAYRAGEEWWRLMRNYDEEEEHPFVGYPEDVSVVLVIDHTHRGLELEDLLKDAVPSVRLISRTAAA